MVEEDGGRKVVEDILFSVTTEQIADEIVDAIRYTAKPRKDF